MIKTVFDANCWSGYVDEQISTNTDLYSTAFDLARIDGSIHLDEGLIIKQQYLDVRRGRGEELFDVFFNEGVITGTIRLTKNPSARGIATALASMGVPRKEYVYFQIAASEPCNFIVSEDIDFFEPSKKGQSPKVTGRIKNNSSGCVCKHFKKNDIHIRNTAGFVAEISLGQEENP